MTDLAGRTALITGSTSGIGLATAEALAGMGADILLVARNATRAAAAVERIRAAGGGREPRVFMGDLSLQADVRAVAAAVREHTPRIDVLFNNAGAIFAGRQLTADGIEATWATNHLAPFLLTHLLMDRLGAGSRVITTSSGAHAFGPMRWDDLSCQRAPWRMGFTAYGQSKLANILFTVELARRLGERGAVAHAFHPGFVGTNIGANNGRAAALIIRALRPFARSPAEAARTPVFLATDPVPARSTGRYWMDGRELEPSRDARDPDAPAKLWSISEQQTGR